MFNLRDIGGGETTDGRVRPGVLWRSNALVELGEDGRTELSARGIKTAVDLREAGERAAEPSDLEGFDLREIPLIDGAGGEISIDLLAFNQWLLENRGERLVEVVRLFSAPENLPAVYFCSTGKDRTGLITALILSAIGVDDDAVVRDYAITETLMPAWYHERAIERSLAGGMPEELIATYREKALGSPAAIMYDTLAILSREHGGARVFLLAHGLEPDALDRLRGALVEPA